MGLGGLRGFLPPPRPALCDVVGREVWTHSWRGELCSAAGWVKGRSPVCRPWLLNERRAGVDVFFRSRGPDSLLYPRFLILGPFTDLWQRGHCSSEFLPSCFQTAGEGVNECIQEEECDWMEGLRAGNEVMKYCTFHCVLLYFKFYWMLYRPLSLKGT